MNTPLKLAIKKKTTIIQCSKDLKIPYETLSNYCRGIRQADHRTLVNISKYLNVPIDVLLDNSSDDEYLKLSKSDFELIKKYQKLIDDVYAKYTKK